ncbi:MAG: hypothetical protein J7513_10795 [Solirubrobacteraceae bacterium]|nr:hypothetical protein [Solirubrobacteraceae bacterium]
MDAQQHEGTDVDWAALDRSVRRWLSRRAPAGAVDDLTQEALLRVHRTLTPEIRSAEAWALRAAHSVLVDHLRTVARRIDAATDPDILAALAPLTTSDASDRPDAGLDANADRALDVAIARCIGRSVADLPAPQREAIELVGEHGLTSAAAAEQAGVSVPGLKSRVQRGRAAVIEQTSQCCRIEHDARGRPLSITPREGEVCGCGCADAG